MIYRHNKKEQDQLPAHTYEEAQKGKKKSSVLIQLSGWLRTLDMANLPLVDTMHHALQAWCIFYGVPPDVPGQ